MQEIIKELKLIREREGKSQREIAEQIGVSKEIVGKWENGKRGITLKNAEEFANALGFELVLAEKK